jgi:hypothetical protein
MLPALPIVSVVAAGLLLAGCDSPGTGQTETITRVCQDANGWRTPDDNCTSRSPGHSFAYVYGSGGRIGDRIDAARSSPGDVSRGGFGMSAHGGGGE